VDLDEHVSKEECQAVFPELQLQVGQCQREARAAGAPVIVVLEGWDAAGKGTLLNRLAQALDPRGFKVHLLLAPTEAERLHPWMCRFWEVLPEAGSWGLFDHSWYRRVLHERIDGTVGPHRLRQAFEDIRQFERLAADAGAIVLKFWLHISPHEQKRRFERLLSHRATAWQVGKDERRQHHRYDAWLAAAAEMIEQTDAAHAPWTIVAATDRRYARLKVFRTIIDAVRGALAQPIGGRQPAPAAVPAAAPSAEPATVPGAGPASMPAAPADAPAAAAPAAEPSLPAGAAPPEQDGAASPSPAEAQASPDPSATPEGSGPSAAAPLEPAGPSLSVPRDEYERELKSLQKRLFQVEHELYLARVPAVIVFEGWDAAGKGGAIRRLTRGLDPRGYEVIPVAAPTAWEKAHHYLWRFWQHVPKAGHITIFDRSWYGRVLVERVEGFCSEAEWQRAYQEINDFERQLADFGTVIVKFWLQIDAEEQLRRFRERQVTPYKQWKITEEDWRNRQKRGSYEPALSEMLLRTSTAHAPWTVLEADCKLFARLKALHTAIDAMQAGM
jgi:polyphosphate kinase 2 (PPK2 family)